MSTSHLAFAWLCCVLVVSIQAEPQGRIVGGNEAAFANQFPYQVSVRKYNEHVCGGSIISANYILTVAHCVIYKQNGQTKRNKPEDITVRAGSIDRTTGGVVVPVAAIKVHENYGSDWNDIALLKLAESLTFSAAIQRIPLATADKPVGSEMIISGWGNPGVEGSDKLQWIVVNVISDDECMTKVQISSEQVICADHPVSEAPCHGDSGGPATYNGMLVGVISFIVQICAADIPDIYINVFHYLPWIKEHSDV